MPDRGGTLVACSRIGLLPKDPRGLVDGGNDEDISCR